MASYSNRENIALQELQISRKLYNLQYPEISNVCGYLMGSEVLNVHYKYNEMSIRLCDFNSIHVRLVRALFSAGKLCTGLQCPTQNCFLFQYYL